MSSLMSNLIYQTQARTVLAYILKFKRTNHDMEDRKMSRHQWIYTLIARVLLDVHNWKAAQYRNDIGTQHKYLPSQVTKKQRGRVQDPGGSGVP